MDYCRNDFEDLENSTTIVIRCSGCGEGFSIKGGELKRRIGRKKNARVFCTIECREMRSELCIPIKKFDSYGRPLKPTFWDDDAQNAYYIVDE